MKFSLKNVLNNIYEAIRSAALYTVIVWVILLAFIADDIVTIDFRDFVTIFFASLTVAFANFLFKIKRLPKFISYILHYFVVTFGLVAVFVVSGKFFNSSQAFSLLFVFTVLYIVLALLFYIIKRILRKTLSHLPSDPHDKKNGKSEQSEEDYRSIL